MNKDVVVSAFLASLTFACGPEEKDPFPMVETDPNAFQPLFLRELPEQPKCFLPIVTIGECPNDTCTAARQFNRDREDQARALLMPYMAITGAIRSAPKAESWSARQTWPEPDEGQTEITATAENRDPVAGAFTIHLHHHGTVTNGGPLPEEIDTYQTQFGLYTPNAAMVDLGVGIIRWTEWVVDISGGFYRGCDPKTEISFDQRMNDDGIFNLFCWDRGGNRVDCDEADLWPTSGS